MSVSQKFNFNQTRTAVGVAGDAVAIGITSEGRKELATCYWSYLDPLFSQTTANNPVTLGIIGRLCVFEGLIRIDQLYAVGAPDAGTDFSATGSPNPIFDQTLYGGAGGLFFTTNQQATEGRIMVPDIGMTIVLCRAWESPKQTTDTLFVPKLNVIMRNIYTDHLNRPYDVSPQSIPGVR